MSAAEPDTAAPRTLANALATLVARGSGLVFRLAVLAEIARYLTPAELGIYGVLASTLDVARVMTNFGLDTAIIRRMAIAPALGGALLRLVLRLKTTLAVVGFAALVALSVLHPPAATASWLLIVLGLALFPVTWSASLTARFQAEHAAHWLIPVQIATGTTYLIILEIAARSGARLVGFVSLILVAELVTFALTAIAARRRWAGTGAMQEAPLPAGPFLRESFPLGLFDMVVVLYARLGVFLLEAQGPAMKAAVGHLYAAMRVNEVTVAIGGALAMSALPVFSKLAHEGRSGHVGKTFLKYSLAGAAFSGSVAIFITLFGRLLIERFRPDYAPAVAPLTVFAWAGIAMFQNNLSTSVINAFGRFRVASASALLNLVVYCSVALVLIPRLGALGAAYSTLATEGLNMLVQLAVVVPMLVRTEKVLERAPVATDA